MRITTALCLPPPPSQLAGGVAAIQLQNKEYDGRQTSCFHLIRPDGSVEDVSYRCVSLAVCRGSTGSAQSA